MTEKTATPININFLGEFSIQLGSAEINDSDNRTRKVWLLLAYMIYYRSRPIPPEELISLLWGEDGRSSNPANALKTMFHRARTTLSQLDERAGRTLILRREGTYAWNTDIPLNLDIDRFDALYQAGIQTKAPAERLNFWLEALNVYQGEFLSKLSAEPWVVPIAAHYHNLYIQMALETLSLLEKQRRWQDIISLCRGVLGQDPYMEELYRYLMNAQIQLGEQNSAVKVYEDMSELLLTQFGVMPSDEMLSLYREAIRTVNDHTVSSGVILEQLRETNSGSGALLCDYDVFKAIYQCFARAVARSGDAVHLALLSISGPDGKELPRRSLDRVVENLQELICAGLRKGDAAARCSVSQFVFLLPQANYENSCMVCDRILKSFTRQYPHSPAQLHAIVQPLEPNP